MCHLKIKQQRKRLNSGHWLELRNWLHTKVGIMHMAIYFLFVAKHACWALQEAWHRLNQDQIMLFRFQSCKQLAGDRQGQWQWRGMQLGTWSVDQIQIKLYAWLHCPLCWLAGFQVVQEMADGACVARWKETSFVDASNATPGECCTGIYTCFRLQAVSISSLIGENLTWWYLRNLPPRTLKSSTFSRFLSMKTAPNNHFDNA